MNVVGQNTVLTGTIKCEKDLFVVGQFEGTVITKGTLYVYPEGMAKGRVTAKDLTVAGKIQGDIEVNNRLKVKNSAKLQANINTRFLDWEEGAVLQGEVHTFF